MKTKDYEYNIYVLDGVLSLSAYQLEIASNGQVQVRTDNYVSERYDMTPENHDVISYLLDSDDWADDIAYWDEHDDWHGLEYLTEGDVPAMIAEWVNNLPEYEMLDRSKEIAN